MDNECLVVDTACRNFKRDIACIATCKAVPIGHVVQDVSRGVQDKVYLVVSVNLENGLVEKGDVASAKDVP